MKRLLLLCVILLAANVVFATHIKCGWVQYKYIGVGSTADTSSQKNNTYQYSAFGTNTASLTVTNSKGCSGTVTKTVIVNNKPQITLPFKDTLICSIDSLPLIAQSTGTFSWSSNYNIINPTSSKPIVFPKDTTVYTVTVAD